MATKEKSGIKIGKHVVSITNRQKIYWPGEGFTKGDLIDYLVCNNKATLLYVANLGCIEINPWNSTTKKIGNPTWMVIDIDPSDKNKFAEVVDTALAVKNVLDNGGVSSYCKTSGASGLHVYVPLKNKYA